MIETCAVLLPLLYDPKDLPKGMDVDKQKELKELVNTAFNTGWRVCFHKIFEFKNVLYERYIFEREVDNGTLNDSNIAG